METEFTVGYVLSRTFNVFSRNFLFMLITAFVVLVPSFIMEWFPQYPAIMLMGQLVDSFFTLFMQGVVAFGVYQHLTGQRMDFSGSLAVALRRFFPLLLVTISVAVLTMVGMFLLIIPGIIISLMMWVAVPVTVVEGGGVGHALDRSKDLTYSYRLRILGVIVILSLLIGAVSLVLFGLMMVVESMGLMMGTLGNFLIMVPIQVLTVGLAMALNSVAVAVGYFVLRREVDGVATEDLAEVFA